MDENENKSDSVEVTDWAFPTSAYSPTEDYIFQPGMTLLDYFARGVMEALINDGYPMGTQSSRDLIAQHSYSMAEAMMAERKRREG